jgi:hypothetical protein
MTYKLFYPLSVVMLVTLVFAAGSAVAQTTAAGPYYATPSWDQKLQCDTQATCPRFIVLSNWNNEAVLDRETGLVWERSPDTNTQDWANALGHCNARIVGKRMGWRLPTFHELVSLFDMSVPFPPAGPVLPPGHPFTKSPAVGELLVGDYSHDTWRGVRVVRGPGPRRARLRLNT